MRLGTAVAATGLAALLALPANACEAVRDGSRIAVAGGSLTEILYFLGAEERIVAVDSTSNYPQQAAQFPSVGYVRALSAEGLLSLNPTLVLGEDDMGPAEVLAAVGRTGVDVVRVPEAHTAAGIVAKVRCIANVLSLPAEELVAAQLTPVVEALAQLQRSAAPNPQSAAFLLGLRDGSPIGAGRATSAHGLLEMASVRNVLADFEGWKPVSMEAMASAAPDYILVTERGIDTAGGEDALFGHPALKTTPAGRLRERMIVLDGMAALGFGPRTLQVARSLALRLRGDPPTSETL